MLADERHRRILGLLNTQRTVMVTELCAMLGISESTVRRDLSILARQGQLIKVHGGATANNNTYHAQELLNTTRKTIHEEQKRQIAQYAASLIVKGDHVYLDGGSTVEHMLDYLQGIDARYVTNSAVTAKRLAMMGLNIILLGGQYRPISETLVGPETQHALRKYNFSKGFFGAAGVSRHAGCTSVNMNEVMVKQQAVTQCSEVYVLADPSKFGVVCAITFSTFDAVRIITTTSVHPRYQDCTNLIRVNEKHATDQP